MGRKTYVIGVGKTKYEKPRNRIGYEELGLQAATKALLDAGVKQGTIPSNVLHRLTYAQL